MKLNRDRPTNNNNIFNHGDFYDCNLHDDVATTNRDKKEFKFFLSSPPPPPSSSSPTLSSPTSCSPNGSITGCNQQIQHRVSKMDTLAGIAIMYGVEVTDIKRINGLMTDRQMFALKSILIPLPGKHSPSPSLSKCLDDQCVDRSSEEAAAPAASNRYSDLLRSSFQSSKLNSISPEREVSPAMTILQNFYAINSTQEKSVTHNNNNNNKKECSDQYDTDQSRCSNQYSMTHQRRSKSIGYNLSENGKLSDDDMAVTSDSNTKILSDKLLRRRQSSVADFGPLKEDCRNTGLALRSKAAAASRIMEPSDVGRSPIISLGNCTSSAADLYNTNNEVRKSCSLSSFQEQDNNNSSSSSSSMWSTSKWRLKSDLQAFSTAAISRPIFDGLPKPIVGRRNKAAID
ncbi:uncharacterized protein LOC124927445 [Impatiens glandulifera]|uniref:uncharacterized protein LOC124927445 n=1 Tax=Impatiens glandulifera TaxID=253017 RepID=UPI001FB0FADE|nr:uncharacterized protein LOC124927445 [Impatiens glandulifera]